MRNKKGYIGPIGDDFPSIFPIIMGLMLFFASVTIAYNNYAEKRDLANIMRANLMISRSVKTTIEMTPDIFREECKKVDGIKANYGVSARVSVLKYDNLRKMLVEDDEFGDAPGKVGCGNDPPGPLHTSIMMHAMISYRKSPRNLQVVTYI